MREVPAIDVCNCPRMDDGSYLLQKFVPNVDYRAGPHPIWSIGRHKLSGRIFAATDGRYYQNENYDCLWLR